MIQTVRQQLRHQISALFELKKTERLWHIPVLASLCTGIPLLLGLYFGNLKYGILSCLAGLVILYLPTSSLPARIITMLACSFGFMISFTLGICFSFNPWLSALIFGIFAFGVHWLATYIRMKPPGSFFFIMIASMASCMPFELSSVPLRVGYIGLGSMLACVLAFIYSLWMVRRYPVHLATASFLRPHHPYASFMEAGIMGFFMMSSLMAGHLLGLENPYWVPISCAAVMQGVGVHHVWQRSFQRILGTLLGLGLCWLLLQLSPTALGICLMIIMLQFIVEMLIVRHYGGAVLFITPMTILLAETGSNLMLQPDVLILARFNDIVLGSLIGALGGWLMYHEKLRHRAIRQLRKTRMALKRR